MKNIKYVILSNQDSILCENSHNGNNYYYHSKDLYEIISDGLHDSISHAESELEFIREFNGYGDELEFVDLDNLKIVEVEVKVEIKLKG